ncbi:hypothetical protein GQ53DRAFT_750312 [Thozetella sp. PMI_491]|nr:hypothetical protein GQ53DRAFT_750312 [Thozetella sp. PMI_491]
MPFTMPWRPLLIFFHLCGWTPIYVLRLLAYFFRVGAAKAYDRIRQRDPRPDPPKPAMVEISAEDIMSSLLWLSIVFVAMVSAALWMERSIWLFDNGFRVPYARELAYRFPERGWGVGSADFRLLYQPFIDYLSNGNLIALFHQLSMSTS